MAAVVPEFDADIQMDDVAQVFSATIWDDIELAESYLVCSMFAEAESKSSSLLRRICDNGFVQDFGAVEGIELLEMKEAAAMVLVQSLKELGRPGDIMKKLIKHFGAVIEIPVEVLLAGTCIQILEAPSEVRSFLEEFLSKWRCVDQAHYVIFDEPTSLNNSKNLNGILSLDKYMEVVEVYAVLLLGKVLNALEVAITWVEKADLPEAKREDLLRRLHSLCSQNSTSMLQTSLSLTNARGLEPFSQPALDGSPKALLGTEFSKQSVLNLPSKVEPCFWLFRTITLKFGSARLVISSGKVLLACMICLIIILIKRKRESLSRTAKKHILSMKKALIDLWQLAFSYQVNPLAAVQPLPVATQGAR